MDSQGYFREEEKKLDFSPVFTQVPKVISSNWLSQTLGYFNLVFIVGFQLKTL